MNSHARARRSAACCGGPSVHAFCLGFSWVDPDLTQNQLIKIPQKSCFDFLSYGIFNFDGELREKVLRSQAATLLFILRKKQKKSTWRLMRRWVSSSSFMKLKNPIQLRTRRSTRNGACWCQHITHGTQPINQNVDPSTVTYQISNLNNPAHGQLSHIRITSQ